MSVQAACWGVAILKYYNSVPSLAGGGGLG